MTDYSQSFLAALGRIAVEWAEVEHELKMHTSFLAAQDTDGWPVDDLEGGFKRLRSLWIKKLRKHAPTREAEGTQLMQELAALAKQRSIALHSRWAPTSKRGQYRYSALRQNQTMTEGTNVASVALVRDVADQIADARRKLRTFTGA